MEMYEPLERPKIKLSQQERDAKNQRWSDLSMKLRDESDALNPAEKTAIREEMESLRKEITQ
ncbi:hypothetical protein KGO95_04135 [Patescibacteria group bacterium]|nr:hypothetical protein [Patescibacteria group bacterium]